MDLTQKKCKPCEAGTPKFTLEEAKKLLEQVPSWNLEENILRKNFKFKNFREAMKFINRMADIAEGEGHHPDFAVHYNRVEVEIWTHAIGGLSENDFILAAKLDQINAGP
jgi:4a-hydroxytetrahydrobiopterin dehydratase